MDKWTGAGVSGAVAQKLSGADPARRAKAAGEAAGKAAGVGVPLTNPDQFATIHALCVQLCVSCDALGD
jgi:hypothetical protein